MIAYTHQTTADLQLLSLLVAKTLLSEHGIATAPAAGDYACVSHGRYGKERPDVRVAADLGRGVRVGVVRMFHSDGERDVEMLTEAADEIASALAHAFDNAGEIRQSLSEVKAATKREIAKATRRGLPYRLLDVAPGTLDAQRMEGFWIEVELEVAGPTPQPQRCSFNALETADVRETFESIVEEQTERAYRRAVLKSIGATGRIDALVVNVLQAEGIDIPETLARLRDSTDWIVDVESPGGRKLKLCWKDDAVTAHVMLGEGVSWHEGKLNFHATPRGATGKSVGKPLRAVFAHPVIPDSVVVRSAYGKSGEHGWLSCSQPMLNFDATDGRVWGA